MFYNYIKTTWRNIARHKGYSFINIAGLALGMACCIVIATYLQFELSYDRFHEKGSRIFRLVERQFFEGQDEQNLGQSTPWMGETLLEYPEVDTAVNFINMGNIWTKYKDEMIEIPRVLVADPDVFEIFSFIVNTSDAFLNDLFICTGIIIIWLFLSFRQVKGINCTVIRGIKSKIQGRSSPECPDFKNIFWIF